MARAVTPAIPLKLYRHFAIVTIALTAALAMFADGESRQARTERDAVRQGEAAAARDRPARFAAPRTGSEPPASAGEFSEDGFDGEFGAPMDMSFAGIRSSIIPSDALRRVGYSPSYLASLSDNERALLLRGLEQNGLTNDAQRRAQSTALAAASARRSGSPAAMD